MNNYRTKAPVKVLEMEGRKDNVLLRASEQQERSAPSKAVAEEPDFAYLVDGIAYAEHALANPLLSPPILLHQTQQHRTAGFTGALLLVLIHLIQMDLKLGIGPVSGWKSLK